MDEDTWVCPNCGEVLDKEFTECWKCAAARDGKRGLEIVSEFVYKKKAQAEATSGGGAIGTPQEIILSQILRYQKEQAPLIESIKWKVSCLFAFMVFVIVMVVVWSVVIMPTFREKY